MVALLGLGGILASATAVQNVYWANDLILYAHGMNVAPRNVLAINHMANEFFKRQRPQAALDLYHHALDIKPQLWQTHFALGITLYELGKYQEATQELEEGVRIGPENSEQYFFLGLSQLSLSNYIRAEEEFKRTLQRNPRRPGLNRALATALLRQGKVEEAKAALRAEIDLTQDRGAVEELMKLEKQ